MTVRGVLGGKKERCVSDRTEKKKEKRRWLVNSFVIRGPFVHRKTGLDPYSARHGQFATLNRQSKGTGGPTTSRYHYQRQNPYLSGHLCGGKTGARARRS
jgi:hypothetical protein